MGDSGGQHDRRRALYFQGHGRPRLGAHYHPGSRYLTRGASFQISGTQFNGLSVGADYGDDATMATNYPLVRITNDATNHVFYARTHDHSTMGIATGTAIVSTTFDVPVTAETGASENRCCSQRNSVETEAGHDPVIGVPASLFVPIAISPACATDCNCRPASTPDPDPDESRPVAVYVRGNSLGSKVFIVVGDEQAARVGELRMDVRVVGEQADLGLRCRIHAGPPGRTGPAGLVDEYRTRLSLKLDYCEGAMRLLSSPAVLRLSEWAASWWRL